MSDRLFNPLTKIIEKSAIESAWIPPVVSETDQIPTGDMPGDKIKIGVEHIAKAQKIFPELCKQLMV
ncbi:MAG: adenylylsulfate kinase, partial [Mobilitalea sp.]